MTLPVLIAIGLAALPLAWLAWKDPKRLRSARSPHPPAPAGLRRVAWLSILAIGGGLSLSSTAAGVLIWLAALTLLGWLFSQWLSPQPR